MGELIKTAIIGYAVAFATVWLLHQTQAFSNSQPWLLAIGPAFGVVIGRWWQLRRETAAETPAAASQEVSNG